MVDPGSVRWLAVGRPEALSFDPGSVVLVGGLELAIFKVAGAETGYCAVANSCPHAGASLAEGHLTDGEVSCPWHGWRFDLRTGHCKTIPEDSVRAFPLRFNDGILEVGLDG
jgi:nitrite reductase (NADH) small subunit/3-phenylpropionate/trans-cinnamate dioxygenase ferredoxin subunit